MSILNQISQEKIKELTGILLKVSVGIFIFSAIMGSITILTNFSEFGAKAFGISIIIGLSTLVSTNGLNLLSSENKFTQITAIVLLASNVIWAIGYSLMILGVIDYTDCTERRHDYYTYISTQCVVTAWGVITAIATSLACLSLSWSNVSTIKSNNKAVQALKYTVYACIGYTCIFFMVNTIASSYGVVISNGPSSMLAIFSGFMGVLAWIIAHFISKSERKEQDASRQVATINPPQQPTPKTDEQLRAEIEEQVRREMIEKEVRARMEAQYSPSPSSTPSSTNTPDDSSAV